jgi:WD40 repeat protein
VLTVLLLALVCSCGRSPTDPRTTAEPLTLPKYDTIDRPEALSPDGRMVVFRRLLESPYGPPGLYLIRLGGGPPQCLAQASYSWPTRCRFSPNGRYVVATDNLQVVVIDLATGTLRSPFFTNSGVNFVDWSPNGKTLLCSRAFSYRGQTEDSTGIHLFDLGTGEDRPFLAHGRHVYGRYPAWSPDGTRFALVEYHEGYYRLSVYTVATGDVTVLGSVQTDASYQGLQWIRATRCHPEHLVYQQVTGEGGGPYAVYMDGTREPLGRSIANATLFSSDGTRVLETAADPVDSIGVVFMLCTGRCDCPGPERVQVTAWWPTFPRRK